MTHQLRTGLSALILGSRLVAAARPAEAGGDGDTPEVASLDTATTADTDPDVDGDDVAAARPRRGMLAYTECMREHGIDMPDPQPAGAGGEGGAIALEVDPSSEEFEAAQAACEPIMEDAFGEMEIDPEREAEMREQMLAFAECMREHGIDMPDPVFGEGGRVEISAGEASARRCQAMDPTARSSRPPRRPAAGDDGFMITTETAVSE